MATLYYESDADPTLIAGRKVAILGYGSQGHAHALNLLESGVDVRVALREGSSSRRKAEEAGLRVTSLAEAAAEADLIMVLLPDTEQKVAYDEHIAPHLNEGDALFFAHGFNIRFGQIVPPAGVDVGMVAPKGPGHLVRRTYTEGGGVPTLIAVHQDASGKARQLALSYAHAIGSTRAGVLDTTFEEETETDLFGEQVVLCGGLTALVTAGFETLVNAGYTPESAYFECLHELKLIVDLMYEQGIAGMRYSISDTAEYGDVTRGPRVINEAVRAEMQTILDEIRNGSFAEEWIAENKAGRSNFERLRKEGQAHQIETVGQELRSMMPFIAAGKTRVQDAVGGLMPFLEPEDMIAGDPLPGWHGRFFHAENMTFAHYDIDAGAQPLHEHHHEQEEVWHVVEGEVALTVDGREQTLGAGSVAIVPPHTTHSVRPLGSCRAIIADYPLRPNLPGVGHTGTPERPGT